MPLLIFSVIFLTFTSAFAQISEREISEEITEKNYTIYEDGKPIKKSVKISTTIRQAVKFDTLVENNIDASRVRTPKEITKMVSIDNDADPDYDETIKFSYASDANEDFLLGVNDEEIFLALENSKYLKVKDKKDISEQSLNEMIVITDTDGKVIQLVLEAHQSGE